MESFWTPFFSALKVFADIATLGFAWDKLLKPDRKISVRNLMQSMATGNIQEIAESFIRCFDAIFDPSDIGRPSIWRSMLMSCLMMAFTLVCWWQFSPERFWDIIRLLVVEKFENGYTIYWGGVLIITIFGIIINIIGDVFSIWETRFVLGKLASSESTYKQMVLLVLDLIASVFIFCVCLLIATSIFMLLWDFEISLDFVMRIWMEFVNILEMSILNFPTDEGADFISVFFLTTMCTSVWVWLFIIGVKCSFIIRWISRYFDYRDYPVAFAMFSAGMTVSILIILIGLALWAF